jgi:hypothetical protein
MSSLLPDRPSEFRQKLAALAPVRGRKVREEFIELVNCVAIDRAGTDRRDLIAIGIEVLVLPDFAP